MYRPKNPIPLFKVFMAEQEVRKAVPEILTSGYIAQGPAVEVFEYQLKKWLDVEHLLTVNSGTSALQLACTLANVKYDDIVISTPMTCTATNCAIKAVGGLIEWADIDPSTGNINPESVQEILEEDSTNIKAIMAVDWGGRSCNWNALRIIADKYDLKLIDDAAHAFGTRYKEKYLGHVADYTCFSFQAIKHLTTIDGGALICRDEADHKRGKLLRWFGIDREQERKDFRCEADIIECGFKYHMNDVCATVGLCNLPYMHYLINKQREHASLISYGISNYLGKGLIDIPVRDDNSSYWLYTVFAKDRPGFMKYLMDRNITVSQVHARNDTHTAFIESRKALPGVDAFVEQQCNIPCGWWLTSNEIDYIIETITNYCEENK